MKKKIVKKATKLVGKKVSSSKVIWHKRLPLKWSYFSISIMIVLAAIAIILPHNGVLGASTGPRAYTQAYISVVSKDRNITFDKSWKITGDARVYHPTTTLQKEQHYRAYSNKLSWDFIFPDKTKTKNIKYIVNIYVPTSVDRKTGFIYKLNRPSSIIFTMGEQCTKQQPCRFILSKVYTCDSGYNHYQGSCVSPNIYHAEHMISVSGTCKQGYICAKYGSKPYTCTSKGGYCSPIQACRGAGGTNQSLPGCSSGQICCK